MDSKIYNMVFIEDTPGKEKKRKKPETTAETKKRKVEQVFVEDTPQKQRVEKRKKTTKKYTAKPERKSPISTTPFYPELSEYLDLGKPILHRWYSVPRRILGKEEFEKCLDDLSVTGTQVNYLTGVLPDPTPAYLLDNEYFHMPKHYGIKNFGSDFIDKQRYGFDAKEGNLEYNKDFPLDEKNRNQESAFEACIQSLKETHGGSLLALPPGDGKTTVGCYLISVIKKITLVVVPSEMIGEQWIERIKQYLPKATIGQLRADKVDFEGKDIVITTIQSLCKDKYPEEVLQRFGFVIYDEAHRILIQILYYESISLTNF